jgi:hypothetical protein
MKLIIHIVSNTSAALAPATETSSLIAAINVGHQHRPMTALQPQDAVEP